MTDETAVLAAESRFFDALLAGDAPALDDLLAADFLIVDVFTGSVTSRGDLIGALSAGVVRFEAVVVEDSHVRLYGTAAVVTGSTRMSGTFGQSSFGVHSRYTHVYVVVNGRWRLASAQGTQIAAI